MNYSYVMGIGKEIENLIDRGFSLKSFDGNYRVEFPDNKSQEWEKFISEHLEQEYWNEYITDTGVVFLFQLENGLKRYEVYNLENAEVLELCEKLCQCRFGTIKSMLAGNEYYYDKIK